MSTPSDHINLLLTKYLARTATVDEEQQLMEWVVQQEASDQVINLLKKQWDELNTIDPQFDAQAGKAVLDKIVDQPAAYQPTIHRVHFLRTAWFRVAVAILVIVGLGTYLWNQHLIGTDDVATKPVPVQNDVLPGSNKATLTLSDGSTVELNNSIREKITDGNISIDHRNGELLYGASNMVVTNTMTTPKGGQYRLTLADGTTVWLNAASAITYPTAFTGNTREVKIEGEGYFEVKADPSKPFIVTTPNEKITVLGTSFNVNVYTDEPVSKTSLITGSIKINQQILRPGQAYMNGKVIATNVQQDMAWKNGAFNFRNTNIESAFRQLARWYNVEIRFEGVVPNKKLGGEIGRDLNLSQVLNTLQDVGIHTRLENNTLVVLPD